MKRKVIQHGPATLTVSLPIKWVRQSGVRKGDDINVEVEGACLRVYPGDAHLESSRAGIDLTKLGEVGIHSILSVLHKSGYDELDIRVSSKEGIRAVQERVNMLLHGYEIVEQNATGCVVKSISSEQPSEVDTLLRRCFLVAISMAKSSMEALEAGDESKLSDSLMLEATSNRLSNYCERLINKSPFKDEKSIYKYLIVWLLESICDDYRDIIRHELAKTRGVHKKSMRKPSEAAIRMYSESVGLLENYYHFFYSYNDLEMEKVRAKVSRFRKMVLGERLKSEELMFSIGLSSVAGRISDCFGATIGLHH